MLGELGLVCLFGAWMKVIYIFHVELEALFPKYPSHPLKGKGRTVLSFCPPFFSLDRFS